MARTASIYGTHLDSFLESDSPRQSISTSDLVNLGLLVLSILCPSPGLSQLFEPPLLGKDLGKSPKFCLCIFLHGHAHRLFSLGILCSLRLSLGIGLSQHLLSLGILGSLGVHLSQHLLSLGILCSLGLSLGIRLSQHRLPLGILCSLGIRLSQHLLSLGILPSTLRFLSPYSLQLSPFQCSNCFAIRLDTL